MSGAIARRAAAAVVAGALLRATRVEGAASDLHLGLDAPDARWHEVVAVEDGARGGAASFRVPGARVDAGPCPFVSSEPFTLEVSLRTKDGGFSTALMARDPDGGEV